MYRVTKKDKDKDSYINQQKIKQLFEENSIEEHKPNQQVNHTKKKNKFLNGQYKPWQTFKVADKVVNFDMLKAQKKYKFSHSLYRTLYQ